MAIPKPKQCNQNWLEMKPTESGRICEKCEKTIVDFSKMKWKEIELIQTQNNNSVCGMYSDLQLNYWGTEPKKSLLKLPSAAASSLILMLAQLNVADVVAQTTPEMQIVEDSTVTDVPILVEKDTVSVELRGYISREEDGEPAAYAKVKIVSDNDLIIVGAYVDENGFYSIKLRYPIDLIRRCTVVISYEGEDLIDYLSSAYEGVLFKDYLLPPSYGNEIITFSIRVPYKNKWQQKRYDRKLKRLDKKNKE